jgi:hypothetical protein
MFGINVCLFVVSVISSLDEKKSRLFRVLIFSLGLRFCRSNALLRGILKGSVCLSDKWNFLLSDKESVDDGFSVWNRCERLRGYLVFVKIKFNRLSVHKGEKGESHGKAGTTGWLHVDSWCNDDRRDL